MGATLAAPRVDRHHNALGTELGSGTGNQIGISYRCGIYSDLVRPGSQQ
jgi:hypothetical protein